jgi:hypothetical protein
MENADKYLPNWKLNSKLQFVWETGTNMFEVNGTMTHTFQNSLPMYQFFFKLG